MTIGQDKDKQYQREQINTCSHTWTKAHEGLLISGRHFHLYKCLECGLWDLGLDPEEEAQK